MTALPEGLYGRLLAFGLCGVAILAFYLVAVAPTLGLYAREQHLLEERSILAARLERAAAQLPRLREASQRAGKGAGRDSLVLPSESDTIAVATLQTLFKSLAERAGAKLTNIEILPPEASDKLSRVAIRASFTADLRTLTTLLGGVEASRPSLFVDRLEIRTADKGQADARGPSLAVALDVYGLRLPP